MVSLILDGFINASSSNTLVSTCRSAQIFPKINEVSYGGSISSLTWGIRWLTLAGSGQIFSDWKQRAGSSVMRKALFVTTLLPFLTPSLTPRLERHVAASRYVCSHQSDPSGRVSVCSTSWQKAQKSRSQCSSRCCSQQQASKQTWWREIGVEEANVHLEASKSSSV